jgi:CheY-like chemotaxis protein
MRNILIIEDDNEIVELINSYFKEIEVAIDHVGDGLQAIDLILEEPDKYDLILVDRVLPGIDGIELIKKIKNSSSSVLTPVVMITSSAKDEQVSNGIKAGAFYYLIKPLRKKSFLTVVEKSFAYVDHDRNGRKYFNTFLRGNNFVNQLNATIRNYKDVKDLSYTLSFYFKNPDKAFRGIYELIINSVEHGLYNIGKNKNKLIKEGKYADQLESSYSNLANNNLVKVSLTNNRKFTQIEIQDPGEGFNWKNFLSLDPANSNKESGKGVAYAKQVCFDEVIFNKKGNVVMAKMYNETSVS